jgi:NAD(P)-dependent dehydrogenase (short-subunit alcohol dehydrogenase family)
MPWVVEISIRRGRFSRKSIQNQAIPSSSHIEDLTEEHFDNVIATNLKGMFTVIKPVIPEMKKRGGGKIVTLGSEMGFAAVPESPACKYFLKTTFSY